MLVCAADCEHEHLREGDHDEATAEGGEATAMEHDDDEGEDEDTAMTCEEPLLPGDMV